MFSKSLFIDNFNQAPDIPLVYLTLPSSYSYRIAIVAPSIEEDMDVVIRQVRQLPGYALIWRGVPASVQSIKAQVWMMKQPNHAGFQIEANLWMDYRDPANPDKGLGSARSSFASVVAVMAKQAGRMPSDVLVIKLT